jgi:flavin reductase (DIM6/NTAB) family NADH-FMN oxidoreductase RutF
MKVNPATLSQRDQHRLMTSVIVPRPIAWVSTVSAAGVNNLAPYSAFTMIGDRPVGVGVGIVAGREGRKKDTLVNIEFTRDFVVNIVNESLAAKMNLTSGAFPEDVSEFEKAGLTAAKADVVNAPLLAESPINLECRLLQIVELGEHPRKSWFVIGEVLLVHVKDEVMVDGEIQMSRLKAIGRLGRNDYCSTQGVFEMKRPA